MPILRQFHFLQIIHEQKALLLPIVEAHDGILVKIEAEPAPMLLGYILGPLMEENLRRAMLLARGDFFVFFQRPISATLLVISILLLVFVLLPNIRKKRDVAFEADD